MSYVIYSASPAPLGVSEYRLVGVDAPAQYVPRIIASTSRNASGTNIDYRLKSDYPLLVTVDGVITNNNTFRMETKFSALQNVLNDTERARIFDEHVQFLVDNRSKILNGDVTPVTP